MIGRSSATEVARGLQQSRDNIGMMQEEDYI